MSKDVREFCCVTLSPFCELNCIFCSPRHTRPAKRILQNQFDRAMKNIDDFIAAGFKNIEISGADPIFHERIIDLIQHINRAGFRTIRLSSNLIRCADPAFSEALVLAGINSFRVPIYGSSAAAHDAITGSPGSFKLLMTALENIQRLANENIELILTTLLTNGNKHDTRGIIELMSVYGPTSAWLSIPMVLETSSESILQYHEMASFVQRALSSAKHAKLVFSVYDIPACACGIRDQRIKNSKPPAIGRLSPAEKKLSTKVRNTFSYRIKEKIPMCASCVENDACGGFYKNYLTLFGSPKLKPLTL